MSFYEAMLAKVFGADHADDVLTGGYVEELDDEAWWPYDDDTMLPLD